MKKTLTCAALVVACATVSNAASAAEAARGDSARRTPMVHSYVTPTQRAEDPKDKKQLNPYISVKLGLVMPTFKESGKWEVESESGTFNRSINMTAMGFSGAFGVKFSDFRVEIEGNTHTMAKNEDKFGHDKLSNSSIMLNGYYDFPLSIESWSRDLWLYAGVGLGYNRAALEQFDKLDGGITMNGGGFAWQISLGAATSITDNLIADVGGRYFSGGEVKYNWGDSDDYVRFKADLSYFDFRLGLRYSF